MIFSRVFGVLAALATSGMPLPAARADTLRLKDGRVLTGTMTSKADGVVWFRHEVNHLPITDVFSEADVERIEIDPATQIEVPKPAPKDAPPAEEKPKAPPPPPPRKQPPKKDPKDKKTVEEKPAPLAPIPVRVDPAPIDLKDRDAVAKELASLSGYTHILSSDLRDHQYNDVRGQEGAVGWYPYPSRTRAMDATVRFDRLKQMEDEELRNVAAAACSITLDTWRVNRFYERSGDTPEYKRAEFLNMVWSGVKAAAAVAIQEETSVTEVTSYYDHDGNLREIQGPRTATIDIADDAIAEYNTAADAWKNRSLETAKVRRLALSAQAVLADEMAVLWQKHLLPRLMHEPLEDTLKARVSVSSSDSQLVSISNRSNEPITGLLIAVEAVTDKGSSEYAYLLLPELQSKCEVTLQVLGSAMREFENARSVEARVRLQSDQGSAVFEKVRLPTGRERNPKPSSANAKKEDEARTAAQRKLRAEGYGFLKLAHDAYGTPANPTEARKRIAAGLDLTRDYRANLDYGKTVFSIQLSMTDVDEKTGVYTGRAVANRWPDHTITKLELCGTLVEEPERGCVLTLVDSNERNLDALTKRDRWFLTAPEELVLFEPNPIRFTDPMAGMYGINPWFIPGLELKRSKAARALMPQFVVFLNRDNKLCIQGRYMGDRVPKDVLEPIREDLGRLPQ